MSEENMFETIAKLRKQHDDFVANMKTKLEKIERQLSAAEKLAEDVEIFKRHTESGLAYEDAKARASAKKQMFVSLENFRKAQK